MNTDTREEFSKFLLLDDLKYPGDTLAKRRLQAHVDRRDLYPLSIACYFLADVVRYSTNYPHFIDSSGKYFKYRKNTRAQVMCKRITRVLPQSLGALLEVEDMTARFPVLFAPTRDIKYAIILRVGMSLILYGLSDKPIPETWRLL